MTAIRFFTDEDVYDAVATALCRRGIDVCSTPQVGRRGQSDQSQLEWASLEGRVFFTFNVAHFAEIHAAWLREARHHAGIVVSQQRPIGEVVQRLAHLAAKLDADAMRDHLEFLSRW